MGLDFNWREWIFTPPWMVMDLDFVVNGIESAWIWCCVFYYYYFFCFGWIVVMIWSVCCVESGSWGKPNKTFFFFFFCPLLFPFLLQIFYKKGFGSLLFLLTCPLLFPFLLHVLLFVCPVCFCFCFFTFCFLLSLCVAFVPPRLQLSFFNFQCMPSTIYLHFTNDYP